MTVVAFVLENHVNARLIYTKGPSIRSMQVTFLSDERNNGRSNFHEYLLKKRPVLVAFAAILKNSATTMQRNQSAHTTWLQMRAQV